MVKITLHVFGVAHHELLELPDLCFRLLRQGQPAEGAVLGDRRVDVHADLALDRLHLGFLFPGPDRLDAVVAEHLGVNIGPAQVGIGLEHVRGEVSPHHEFDHALVYPLCDQVRDAGVAEDVRGEVLLDSCPLRNPLQPAADGRVDQLLAVAVQEDKRLPLGSVGVVGPPLCEILAGHDQADVAGLSGLEGHVGDHAELIELQVTPPHPADLADAETPLVKRHDDGPVGAAPAGPDHRLDLVGGQEVPGNLGAGVSGRGAELLDFCGREVEVLVLDQPEKEPLEFLDPVVAGVQLVGGSAPIPGVLKGRAARVDVPDGQRVVGAEIASPADHDVGVLVDPAVADAGT